MTDERIANGVRYRANLPIVLQAELDFGTKHSDPLILSTKALGFHNGKLHAPAATEEKLPQNGPPDRQIMAMLQPKNASDDFGCTAVISYNASRVPLTKTLAFSGNKSVSRSQSFMAQKINRIVAQQIEGPATLSGAIIISPETPTPEKIAIPGQPVGAGANEALLYTSGEAAK